MAHDPKLVPGAFLALIGHNPNAWDPELSQVDELINYLDKELINHLGLELINHLGLELINSSVRPNKP